MLHLIDNANRHLPQYAQLLEDSFRVRYDLYVKGRGWKALDRPDEREVDQFDNADASYLIWADGSEIVGGIRLIPTDKPHLMSEVFPQIVTLGTIPRRRDIWEITRLFTSRGGNSAVNRKSVTNQVFCGMFEFAITKNLEAVTVVCDTFFLPRLLEKEIEVNPLGLPTPYDEGTCIAVYIPVNLQQLSAARGPRRESVLFQIETPPRDRQPAYAGSATYANN